MRKPYDPYGDKQARDLELRMKALKETWGAHPAHTERRQHAGPPQMLCQQGEQGGFDDLWGRIPSRPRRKPKPTLGERLLGAAARGLRAVGTMAGRAMDAARNLTRGRQDVEESQEGAQASPAQEQPSALKRPKVAKDAEGASQARSWDFVPYRPGDSKLPQGAPTRLIARRPVSVAPAYEAAQGEAASFTQGPQTKSRLRLGRRPK